MKISLITACYNSGATLPATIMSVQRQLGVDCEYIVVDGASKDDTQEIIGNFDETISKWVSEPDNGLYDALNRGLGVASGEVIGHLHADDMLAHEQVLQAVADAFDDPDVLACYGDLVYVRRDDPQKIVRYWRSKAFDPIFLRRGWMPPHPTLFVRRSLFEKFGPFNTKYEIASDYEWMLRVLSRLSREEVAYIPEVLVKMRVGGMSNKSLGNVVRKSMEDYRAMRSHGIGGITALAWKNVSKLGQFVVRRGA